jgi:hypothetical protein
MFVTASQLPYKKVEFVDLSVLALLRLGTNDVENGSKEAHVAGKQRSVY